jgi:serine/threonine-protein kinase
MAQACEGLRAARRMSVIHRDIKPANIMLTGDGVVKLVDFGLAKVMFDESYKTMEGTVLGTPRYMSPEQATGRSLDHRSDIYSLGATFYHVLTGRPPFDAESPVQIMMKHATAPLVPPRNVNPTVPQEFDSILCRCMRKDPNDRFQEYDELISELKAVQLQCMAQERGSVLGADGRSTGVSVHGSRSSASVPTARSLTAIPSPPSFHSVQAPASPAAPLPPAGEFGPPPSGLTLPAKIGIAVGALLILGIGGMMAIGPRRSEPQLPPATATEPRSPLASLLARVAEDHRGPATAEPPDPDFVAFLATLEILNALSSAALSAELDTGEWPRDLATLASSEGVTVNFDTNSRGEPLDGWARRFDYSRHDKTIRSAGLNGTMFDEDDILYRSGDGIMEPALYRELRAVDERRRRGR